MVKPTETNLISEPDFTRREALRVLGCFLCAAALPTVWSEASAQTLATPMKVLDPSETLAADAFKLLNVAGDPAILYASKTALAGSLASGHVWLALYSRICSHRSTVVIDPPHGQIMTCPRHHQAYDLRTGQPTGLVQRTQDPLAQYGLQLRPDGSVWATGLVRPQAG